MKYNLHNIGKPDGQKYRTKISPALSNNLLSFKTCNVLPCIFEIIWVTETWGNFGPILLCLYLLTCCKKIPTSNIKLPQNILLSYILRIKLEEILQFCLKLLFKVNINWAILWLSRNELKSKSEFRI